MTTIMKISSRNLVAVRRRSLVTGGMAAILASGLAPSIARAEAKKLVFAHINAVPESGAVAFDWQAQEAKKDVFLTHCGADLQKVLSIAQFHRMFSIE